MVDATAVRAQATTFSRALRGFHQAEVEAYLGRIALAVEAVGGGGALADVPHDLTPVAIRQREFTVGWRGYNRKKVKLFLAQLADDFEKQF